MPYPSNVGGVNCGRAYDSEGNILNTTDMIKALYDALVTNGDAGVSVQGRKVTPLTLFHGTIVAGDHWYSDPIPVSGMSKLRVYGINPGEAPLKLYAYVGWTLTPEETDPASYLGFTDITDGQTPVILFQTTMDNVGVYAQICVENNDTTDATNLYVNALVIA